LVDIDNTRLEKLKKLLLLTNPQLSIVKFDRKFPADFTEFEIFYNGTGLGKMSEDPASIYKTPLLEKDVFPTEGVAIDANYHPWQTAFLKEFAKRNYLIVNGFGHMIASSAIHLSKIANKKIEFQALKKLVC
jgi:shikimate 5-dehydrogenase